MRVLALQSSSQWSLLQWPSMKGKAYLWDFFFQTLEYERRFWVWASVFGVTILADSYSYWNRTTYHFFPPHVRYTLHQLCRPINPSILIVVGYLIGKLCTTTWNFNAEEFVQSFSLFWYHHDSLNVKNN